MELPFTNQTMTFIIVVGNNKGYVVEVMTFVATSLNMYDKLISSKHHDVIKWKHFPRYRPFVPGNSQRPVTRSFDVFFDLCPNKRLSKYSWGWGFETPSCPLWRHYNVSHNNSRDWHMYDVKMAFVIIVFNFHTISTNQFKKGSTNIEFRVYPPCRQNIAGWLLRVFFSVKCHLE